jgi:hypothetical protein
MDQLKRDLMRAGYLGSPRAAITAETCQATASNPYNGTPVAGIIDYTDNVSAAVALADPNNLNASSGEVTFDRVVLMGNYSTSGEYAVGTNNASNGSSVSLGRNWQSFRRDFTNWEDGSFSSAIFNEVFLTGRMIRVHGQDEKMYFGSISGTTGTTGTTDPQITLASAIPAACIVAGGWVSPLNSIVYEVQAASDDETTRFATANGSVAVLRRFEAVGNDHTAVLQNGGRAADSRSVLDYVVSFNLSFRASGAQTSPNTLDWAPAAASVVNNTPEMLRSAIIDIAARTPEQEPEMFVTTGAPLRSFRLFLGPNNQNLGAARVRAAHAEVFLPNIAYRGY